MTNNSSPINFQNRTDETSAPSKPAKIELHSYSLLSVCVFFYHAAACGTCPTSHSNNSNMIGSCIKVLER